MQIFISHLVNKQANFMPSILNIICWKQIR